MPAAHRRQVPRRRQVLERQLLRVRLLLQVRQAPEAREALRSRPWFVLGTPLVHWKNRAAPDSGACDLWA